MRWFLKRAFGAEKLTKYESDYLHDTNMRTSIYMSSVVVVLEIWMIIRFIVKYSIPRGYSLAESMSGMKHFFILLGTGLFLLIFAVYYTLARKKPRRLGNFMIVAFAAISLYFGIMTSLSDLEKGYQIICFLNMIMFAACLLIWKPYISIIMLIVVFYLFGFLGNARIAQNIVNQYADVADASLTEAELGELIGSKQAEMLVNARKTIASSDSYFWKWMFEPSMQKGDVINLVTFWISLVMISISIYAQRVAEAQKDESLEIAYDTLRTKSRTDKLTEISNASFFVEQATKMLQDENVNPLKKVFLFINIENFSNYNEKYGFEGGNEFLKKCAAIIRASFPDDLYARFSDDHFLVLTDEETAENRLKTMKEKVEKLESVIRISFKAGGFIPGSREEDPRAAVDHARYACNLIKHRKNVFYQLYDEKMAEDFKRKQYIINSLDEAIDNGYVKPYYQPVVWAGDRSLCGTEALARWIDPTHGFLSPGAFVPVLEEYKEIHKLDASIMESVCRDIREHLDRNDPIVPVSINFSRLDFELTDIVATFESLVEKYNVPKEYLHVEITESAISEQVGVLRDNIEKVKSHGYAIWLDDFGSGYSALNSLKDYDFDLLKLDMVFLKNFENTPKARPIIENVLNLARSVNMDSLTEGVETAEQADFLTQAGSGRLQGYYFGKPMTIEELDENIRNGKYKVSEHLFDNA